MTLPPLLLIPLYLGRLVENGLSGFLGLGFRQLDTAQPGWAHVHQLHLLALFLARPQLHEPTRKNEQI